MEAEDCIRSIYDDMKKDRLVRSFYISFVENFANSYLEARKVQIPRDVLLRLIQSFLRHKEETGEIVMGHTLFCISCRKKILGPYGSKKPLPKLVECPNCNCVIDTENDYLLTEDKFFFVGKAQEAAEIFSDPRLKPWDCN